MSTKISIAKIKSEADRAYNKADDMHLLASIQNRIKQGLTPLIQPISLKKIDANPVYDYVVEDGRRRFKALDTAGITEIELGQDAVLIDGDSEVNAYVANQHTNLSLAEEIKKLYSMREKFKTLDAVAAEIGHSPTWVARRLNLMNLSDLWKKAMAEKVFGYMSIAHYETIATFPPTIQDEIFDYIRSVEGRDMKSLSIRKFSETLYEKFATLLSSLPWKEEGCGECPACKERKESGYLFANLIPEPRCMNREYLEKKRKEYVANLAAKEPETLLVSNNYPTKEDDKKDENDPLAENTVLGPDEWKVSVMVASMIRPLPSISQTEAPVSSPYSSLTVPCTAVICADTPRAIMENSDSNIYLNCCFIVYLLPLASVGIAFTSSCHEVSCCLS